MRCVLDYKFLDGFDALSEGTEILIYGTGKAAVYLPHTV